eukprot:CAMPEP_0198217216 /NCGR_PEP_ID=MMETSP1445-20131203/62260_1 /TAXON_ID=36898 /ORGANISM="Pyramimonas sp., Strain CCMP2087" /LENGTH=89 /DNA_ID=CAMNT_0043893799 /DNA_START=66 /DNA_END=336 /DNA_ORIENTATION=+
MICMALCGMGGCHQLPQARFRAVVMPAQLVNQRPQFFGPSESTSQRRHSSSIPFSSDGRLSSPPPPHRPVISLVTKHKTLRTVATHHAA